MTDGKLNAGTYTVKLYAEDAAGNESSPYNITVTVTGEEPVTPGGDDETPEDEGGSGCFGNAAGSFIGLAVLAAGGAVLALKKKKE